MPRVTAAGWALVALAVLGWGLGLTLEWTELRLLGASATVVLLVCLLAVLLPRPATASAEARPGRTAVGSTTTIDLRVRAGALPLASPVVRLEGDVASQVLRLPSIWPGRERAEAVEHHASRRGIFTVGPVRHVQSDPLGLFRRTHTWGEATRLWVRPRVIVPDSFSLGGVFDLEGLASDTMSMSDLAFHALREYVPGDDLRQVHWRSSAKADTLLVRQYVESRSMHAAVVVDDDPSAYASDDELELAISVAASLAIRALTDGYEVDLCCGARTTAPTGRESLLDETCAWSFASPADAPVAVASRAAQVARTTSAIGVGVVLSGSRGDLDQLLEASSTFGGDAQRIAVRIDPAGESSVRSSHGVRVLEVTRLEELPRLSAWVAT